MGDSQALAAERAYRICPTCGTRWDSFEEFLLDPHIHVNGYQPTFEDPETGLILLTHESPNCGSTIGMLVSEVSHLYEVERYPELKYGTEVCEGHCLRQMSFATCNAKCSMRWVREILIMMHDRVLPPGNLGEKS